MHAPLTPACCSRLSTHACTQSLSDPAALQLLRPAGFESHPVLLDPLDLKANVAAGTPAATLLALRCAAERDLADMQAAQLAASQEAAAQRLAAAAGADSAVAKLRVLG